LAASVPPPRSYGYCLFPDLAADWLALGETVERLASLGDVVAVTATRVEGASHRLGPSSLRAKINLHQLRAAALRRAPKGAASLVDAARAATLDALGDKAGAATIAERRLRANTAPSSMRA